MTWISLLIVSVPLAAAANAMLLATALAHRSLVHRQPAGLYAPYLDLVIAHQVATAGGVSNSAQQKRALEGSPEVTDEQVAALFAAILAAHPDADRAFER
jgi:hypothetical protein